MPGAAEAAARPAVPWVAQQVARRAPQAVWQCQALVAGRLVTSEGVPNHEGHTGSRSFLLRQMEKKAEQQHSGSSALGRCCEFDLALYRRHLRLEAAGYHSDHRNDASIDPSDGQQGAGEGGTGGSAQQHGGDTPTSSPGHVSMGREPCAVGGWSASSRPVGNAHALQPYRSVNALASELDCITRCLIAATTGYL